MLLWSLLAVLTVAADRVPPFQLVAITFSIGGLLGLIIATARGRLPAAKPTTASFALGLYGLFGDTTLYFAALKLAPAAEANLIHYLWPLLIVIFAGLMPGGALKSRHVLGALIGLAATILIVGGRLGAEAASWAGYACAAAGAAVWASYSVLSSRLAAVPTESVSVTLLAAALLATAAHLALETTIWPAAASEWAGVIGLGLGPVGAAFFLWDIGVKRGDVPFLGVASYAAPVLSTLVLVAAGLAEATVALAAACVLTVTGALIASRPMRARALPTT